MKTGKIKRYFKGKPAFKEFILNVMIHPVKTRPRFWMRLFMPFYIKRGRGSVIYRSVRKDIAPFNKFSIGKNSVIEDFSIVNNLVGDVKIGDYTRIGLGNVVIGPVKIGDHVNLAQNITLSGIDHNFRDVSRRIDQQGVSTSQIVIEDDVWIGANSVVTKGIKIGRHSVVAACSLVNRDVPPYSVVAGNPARVIRCYDKTTKSWEKVTG